MVIALRDPVRALFSLLWDKYSAEFSRAVPSSATPGSRSDFVSRKEYLTPYHARRGVTRGSMLS